MNIAILGPGVIAQKMAKTIQGVEGATAYAVGARTLDKAQAFAREFGFEKAYGSYEELVQDEAIDLIYVATPHSHHYKYMKLCLEAGQNVLCEKAFTVNVKQTKELLTLARRKKLLLAEAIWTRYLPSRKMIDDIIASGILGDVTSVCANLGYNNAEKERIYSPELAGGALLDLGVYLLNFARMVVPGQIIDVSSKAVFNQYGVDMIDQICLTFEGGQVADLHANTMSDTNAVACINGTKAYLEVTNVNNPNHLAVYKRDRQLLAEYDVPPQITGFEYELQACMDAISRGELECPQMPHSEIVYIMNLMDGILKDWGYEIPDIR